MMSFYAKTKPTVQTINEHTQQLLSRLEELKHSHESLTKMLDDRFWWLLQHAATYHDLGKIYYLFQNQLRSKMNMPELIMDKKLSNIPHNYLSVLLIPFNQLKAKFQLKSEERIMLIAAVGYHHERDSNPDKSLLEEAFRFDLENKIDSLYKHMNITFCKESWNGLVVDQLIKIRTNDNKLQTPSKYNANASLWKSYVLLKGLLHRLDHTASADLPIEDGVNESAGQLTVNFLNNTGKITNEAQKFAHDHRNDNVIMVASTGMGKTEASLLWIDNDKGFITLPLRVSLNAMYDRIKDDIGMESVGLLHSGSLDHLVSDGASDQEYFEAEITYHQSQQLASKLTFTTIDQVLKFPFLYRGYERELATMAYSKVVVDEIQAYNPEIAAMLVRSMELIYRMGGRFMIMTATLPKLYLVELKKRIEDDQRNEIQLVTGQFPSDTIRHHLILKDAVINEFIDEIIEKSKMGKVLVICNTVKRANEIYKLVADCSGKARLLHGLFTKEDRKSLEDEVKAFAKTKNGIHIDLAPGLWITTQIVEASLDIDFDILYTEMSTLDSLFQRMGRCYRSRKLINDNQNIVIATKNCTGIGSIYDKELYHRSIKMLNDYQANPIIEEEKMRLVEELYAPDSLKDTEFYKKFKAALKFLDYEIKPFEITKEEAQKMLRNIETVQVIPRRLWEESSFQTLLDQYEKEISWSRKRNILKKIEEKTISLPSFHYKEKEMKWCNLPNRLSHIVVITKKYESDSGLDLIWNETLFI